MKKKIVYIHGFNSGFRPDSTKVRQLEQLVGPVSGLTLNYPDVGPIMSIGKIHDHVVEVLQEEDTEEVILVGTSHGGYLALYLAYLLELRCIIINPSLKPQLLDRYEGKTLTNYVTRESYVVPEGWARSLLHFDVGFTQPTLTIVATDDEVISFDEHVINDLNSKSHVVVTTGGHQLPEFSPAVCEEITKFANREFLLDPNT